MYKRILAPLDGSPTAEMTLPYVFELATRFGSDVVLFSVIDNRSTVTESLFRSYLGTTCNRLKSELQQRSSGNFTIQYKIVEGNPASEIIREAESGINLIVIASRGVSVDSAWALGNIAAKIVRIASKPVMLIKQPAKLDESDRTGLIKKILVPLDGSDTGEAALPHAQALGQRVGGELVLFHAAEPAPWPFSDDVTSKARDEKRVKIVSDYLAKITREISLQGLKVASYLTTGYPAEEILKCVEKNEVDLIAISTHGRSGVGRWAIGSVTDKLLYAGNTPILVEHSIS